MNLAIPRYNTNTMPTAILETPAQDSFVSARRKIWTRAECELLASLEPFQSQSLELIEGELINRMGKGTLHTAIVAMLLELLAGVFGLSFVIQEPAIDVSPEDNPTSEPQPDLVVVSAKASSFARRRPGPVDIRLLVEVADSSLSFDRSIKAGLYARAGIADYWVVDVRNRRIIVHRDPLDGRYGSVLTYAVGEEIAPLAAPEFRVQVGTAFPDLVN